MNYVLINLSFLFKNEQTGLCFPSTEKISLVSRVSIKYVRKSLRELEEAGLISSQQKAGGVRYFTLYLDKLPPSPVFSSEGTDVTPDDKDLPRDNCHPRDICPDTPCELSPPPRDNCPVTPVTNVTPIREFSKTAVLFGHTVDFTALDFAAMVILVFLSLMYVATIIKDARGYAKSDPMPKD